MTKDKQKTQQDCTLLH